MKNINCFVCHEEFFQNRKDKKFCSEKCKTFASNTLKSISEEFLQDASSLKTEDSFREFFFKYMFTRNGKLDIQKCKSELLFKHIKKDLLFFCKNHNSLQDTASNITAWLYSRTPKNCPICNKETNFYEKDYRTFCSEECYQRSIGKGGCGRLKIENSNIQRYGSISTIQLPEVRKLTLLTLDSRYGVDNPMKVESIKRLSLSRNTAIKRKKSSLENQLKEFLDHIGIPCIQSDFSILQGKQLDIYCPGHNLAIEFNGLYWHSEIFKYKKYHLEKTIACEEKGIQLIHIWEDEWVNNREVVKGLLQAKLGIKKPTGYARQCRVVEGNKADVKDLLERHHIQGSVNSASYYLLLKDVDNKTRAVMTFMRRVVKGKQCFELTRFASDGVHGAFSKLLSYYKKHLQNGLETFSFGDRCVVSRLSNVYHNNGFREVELQDPDYKYHKPGTFMREHKFSFRKSEFLKMGFEIEGKTEDELALEAGLVKIWNCGLIKYVLQ